MNGNLGNTDSPFHEVSLWNVMQGTCNEAFCKAFEKVLENILDPNTSHKEVREISLVFKVKPVDEERSGCQTTMQVKTKLAAKKASSDTLFIQRLPGEKPKATTLSFRQQSMFVDVEFEGQKESQ